MTAGDRLVGEPADLRAEGRIGEKARELGGQAGRVANENATAALHEERSRFPKIGRVRSEENRLAPLRRLQHVVTAGRHQAAADEDDVGDAVELGQLADGIEEDDGAGLALTGKLASTHDGPSTG